MSSFSKDLKKAHGVEEEVKTYLCEHPELFVELSHIETSASRGNFSGWDIKASGFTVEVKNDIMSSSTGNIAFEYFNPRQDKASGIMATEADYFVVVTDEYYLFFNTDELKKELVEEHFEEQSVTGFRNVRGGDKKNSSMYLYKFDYVLNYFSSLKYKIKRNK